MNQINLFRSTDPISSERAAEELVATGKHFRQCDWVLDFLFLFPGSTAKELAEAMAAKAEERWKFLAYDIYHFMEITHRRLPDLRRAGKAKNGEMRKCRVSNRLAQTWIAL